MKDEDPLHSVLREWEAPEPSPAVAQHLATACRAIQRPSLWRRIWSARVTIPVPVLAALLLVAILSWAGLRSHPPAAVVPPSSGYITRVETAGFQPLPDGATRVIRSGDYKQ